MRNFLFLLVIMSTLIVAGCNNNSATKMTTEEQEKTSSSPAVNSNNSFSDTNTENSTGVTGAPKDPYSDTNTENDTWVTGVTEDPGAPKDPYNYIGGAEFTNEIHEEDYNIGNFKEYWTDNNTFSLEDYAKANGADSIVLYIHRDIKAISIHFGEWEVIVSALGISFLNPENVEYNILPNGLPEKIDESYMVKVTLSDGDSYVSRDVLVLLNKALSFFKNRTDDVSDPFIDSGLHYTVSSTWRRK